MPALWRNAAGKVKRAKAQQFRNQYGGAAGCPGKYNKKL
jgi:hypothetical protein